MSKSGNNGEATFNATSFNTNDAYWKISKVIGYR